MDSTLDAIQFMTRAFAVIGLNKDQTLKISKEGYERIKEGLVLSAQGSMVLGDKQGNKQEPTPQNSSLLINGFLIHFEVK